MTNTDPDTVHIAFRSAETGRYLFHVKWPLAKWRRIEAAAALSGMTVEEFIEAALRDYVDDSHA